MSSEDDFFPGLKIGGFAHFENKPVVMSVTKSFAHFRRYKVVEKPCTNTNNSNSAML